MIRRSRLPPGHSGGPLYGKLVSAEWLFGIGAIVAGGIAVAALIHPMYSPSWSRDDRDLVDPALMFGLALLASLTVLGFEAGRRLTVREAVSGADRLRATSFQKILFIGKHPFVSDQLKDIALAAGLQFEIADSPSAASGAGTLCVWSYRDSDSEEVSRYLAAPTHPTVLLVSQRDAADLSPRLETRSVKLACYPAITRNFLDAASELSMQYHQPAKP